ncbi:MAG TPA: sporulation protein YabP [Thermoanaerobacterales bacterium]|nr:sporulation protein YabP [Thermoanaerobacterales bacterium]
MADIKNEEHRIIIKDRELIDLNGILSVKRFDDEEIDLETQMGGLTIKGENMYMKHLNLEKGELITEGHIKSIYYGEHDEKTRKKEGLLKRLFK